MSKTIYTAIFGNYDTLKEPLVVTPGWKYICYTDQDFKSDVWEIRSLSNIIDSRIHARIVKIKFHQYVDDIYSIWIDGSFQIACDLNKWWEDHFRSPITCIKHPWRDNIFQEAGTCIEQKRGDLGDIVKQIEAYRSWNYNDSLLIQSGILMREKCDKVNNLCEEWLDHVTTYSSRDQLSFSYVFRKEKISLVTGWNYMNNKDFIFTKHNKKK